MQENDQPAIPPSAAEQSGSSPVAPTVVTLDIHDVTSGQTAQEVTQHG